MSNSTSGFRRQALHVVVRFHDTVVEDRVFAQLQRPLILGGDGDIVLPPPHEDKAVATVTWRGQQCVLVRSYTDQEFEVTPDRPGQLIYGPIQVDLCLVPQYRLPRPALMGEGDALLGLLVIAMSLVAMYVDFGLSICYDPEFGLRSPELTAFCPPKEPLALGIQTTPEYIARLLKEDYGGSDRGLIDQSPGPDDLPTGMPSIYLPAGNRGPLDVLGGAEETAPEPVRRPHQDDPTRARHQPLKPQPVPTQEDSEPDDPSNGVIDPEILRNSEEGGLEPVDPADLPAEEERGWGFQDWLDANDDRAQKDQLRRRLELTRQRLRIDPEDPGALTQLGYYQYLAEDLEGCAKTYDRYIELYPDDAAGYNNLGLVYKRSGEYAREEGYYRMALALDPGDSYALNNLAVNLAHQQRFDEALATMDELQRPEPEDA
jgi:hypothetical protein